MRKVKFTKLVWKKFSIHNVSFPLLCANLSLCSNDFCKCLALLFFFFFFFFRLRYLCEWGIMNREHMQTIDD